MRGDLKNGSFLNYLPRPRNNLVPTGYFKMLNGYTPVFTNAPESVYEMEITRAAIHSFATFCSKLKPEITGSAKKHLERTLQFRPNPFQDTTKFLYRLATILAVNNTAFIVPLEDEFGGIGLLSPIAAELRGFRGRRRALLALHLFQRTAGGDRV